jgi:ubiquinone/menaquinone biosynthesis C-methylase UbiE
LPWDFVSGEVDLITCSLILEHIENLPFIFSQAAGVLQPGGHFYICELHPYKQYSGSKARFETAEGLQVLECFVHHVSDYVEAALANGFMVATLQEWFDEDDRSNPPRLLSFVFQKA